jgi:hypothetical protein
VDVVGDDLIDGVIRIMNTIESRLVITGREMKDMEDPALGIPRSHRRA